MLLSPLIVYITTHCLTVANIGSFFVTAKRNAKVFAWFIFFNYLD